MAAHRTAANYPKRKAEKGSRQQRVWHAGRVLLGVTFDGATSERRGKAGSYGRRNEAISKIRELIHDLKVGDRLPGERQLGEQFKISRGTIREALQFLGALGVIETRHGGGCFVRAASGDDDGLRAQWLDWVSRHRSRVLESIEVRLACETFAAELGARRASPTELSQLVRALRSMKSALQKNDCAEFVLSDYAFHGALLNAAGNDTLRELVTALGKNLVPNRAALFELPGRMERSFAEHSAIYSAVQAGDPVRAAQAMRQHLESVRQDILLHLLDGDQSNLESAAAAI